MNNEQEALQQEKQAFTSMAYPIEALKQALQKDQTVELTDADDTYLEVVLADVFKAINRPIALIVPTAADARNVRRALDGLSERELLHLPTPDISPYAGVSPDRAIIMDRLAISADIQNFSSNQVLIASAVAWARRIVPPKALQELSIHLEIEDIIDLKALQKTLINGGYVHVSVVEDVGTFSIHKGVIDLFSPNKPFPVRIALYENMIESIREIDPNTQRSKKDLAYCEAVPVREILFTKKNISNAREKLRTLATNENIPNITLRSILKDIEEKIRFFGIESLLPAFFPKLVPIYEQLPSNTCVVVIEPERVLQRAKRHFDGYQQEFSRESENAELNFDPNEFLLSPDKFHASFERAPKKIFCRKLASKKNPYKSFSFPYLTNKDLVKLRKKHHETGTFRTILARIRTWIPLYSRICFSMGSAGAANRLAAMLRAHDIQTKVYRGKINLTKKRFSPVKEFEIFEGMTNKGYRAPAKGIAVITEHELFGKIYRRSSQALTKEATTVANFRELVVGDFIVHLDFGIGKYDGLTRISNAGADVDFLVIQYANDDKLYLPIYRLNRVQKYVGSTSNVRIDKLGSSSWSITKAKVKKQLADIANHLLEIYAQRAKQEGFAFSEPNEKYHEFAASFPYEETRDQARAIKDALADMIKPKPMDRLLCGDVGFGKTEVAMRVAYKAVVDKRQVAMLVPTTVLAEQHYRSFKNRFATTSARVEVLSRFRTTKQAKRILRETEEGKVDILIGTHRILSKDVVFSDLGLLLVDEEQRFGVRHKEKLKEIRSTLDVLTLSATPIPRTMEMAMLGVRDLSMILTPPTNRIAIATYLAKFNHAIIREGIQRELDRGGQVFFVHNRVGTIYNIASEIQKIVPNARIAVGHAQMQDTELEEIMLQFVDYKIDVLVSTTIVESGIDVARANTMFINHADKFGLSQLHQLRGRTGRGGERAYCYLLVQDPKKLKPDAKQRLEIIIQHTKLGAGVQIAHHDLDMRGAGNMLGRDQSGHIESVGFELFTTLLNETIAELKGEPTEKELEPDVRIPVSAYLPEDYIKDVGQRLLFYKRYNQAADDEQVFELHAEIQDRYGRAPEPVEHLKELVLLKITMLNIGAKSIEAGPKSVVIDLLESTPLLPQKVIALIKRKRDYSFSRDMNITRKLGNASSKQALVAAMQMARELVQCLPK